MKLAEALDSIMAVIVTIVPVNLFNVLRRTFKIQRSIRNLQHRAFASS
jgi:hypothetical protein